jgi:thioredoxin 1
MSTSKVIDLNGVENFNQEVLKSDLPVLVDFWAPWCGPCQMMSPILDELSESMEGKVKITKVNTENPENQNLAMEYQIQSIPNMKLFKDGKVIGEFIGMKDKDGLEKEIEEKI